MHKINCLENKEKTPLRPYQLEDLVFYIANPRCANLSDPGTGKTPSVCLYAQYLWEYQNSVSAWAMPKSLLRKNFDELLRFTDFTEEDLVIVDGTPTQRAFQMKQPAKVFLMGFQRFSEDWKSFREIHPNMNSLLVDEIHLGYGGHESKRTQAVYLAMRKMKYFLAMTGTLINGRLDTTFPTINIIEPRYYGTLRNFEAQHKEYSLDGSFLYWKNHEKLGHIFARHAVRRTFAEVYGAEDWVLHKELVDMSPEQLNAYREFEKSAYLELDNDTLTASMGGAHVMRCRQIMQHPERVKLPSGEYAQIFGGVTGKDEQLKIHLVDHRNDGTPLIIYSSFVTEIERIAKLCEKNGLRAAYIHGGVPTSKRATIDSQFRERTLDVVVASPATAGIGFNWEHVDHIIFASLDYMDSSFIQARRRADRGNRKKPLRVTILEYRDSIDQKIFHIVDRKSRDANKVDHTYHQLELSKAS